MVLYFIWGEKLKSEDEKIILCGKLASITFSFIRNQVKPDTVSDFLWSLVKRIFLSYLMPLTCFVASLFYPP